MTGTVMYRRVHRNIDYRITIGHRHRHKCCSFLLNPVKPKTSIAEYRLQELGKKEGSVLSSVWPALQPSYRRKLRPEYTYIF